MSQTLLEKTTITAAEALPSSDYVWVQRSAGTGPNDRKMPLSEVKALIAGLIGAATVDTLGLVRRNTVAGAGTTHFVSGIAEDGTLTYDTPPGAGDVLSPGAAVVDQLAAFDATDGKLLKDSGIVTSNVMLVSNNLSEVDAAVAKTNLGLSALATTPNHSNLTLNDGTNPHGTTKADVGLGNVDNTADLNKPISSATQTALNTKINNSEKGVAGGVATLDGNGLVPALQLPSYVDDVLEYNTIGNFPATGESGKIYVTKDTRLIYRWTGTQYVTISTTDTYTRAEVDSNADGRHIPVGVIWMYDGTGWVDNVTIPGWYACVAANAGQGCPDMVDRFVMGKVVSGSGATGGVNSYSLTVGQLPAHNHSINHTHTASSGSSGSHDWSATSGTGSANHSHTSPGYYNNPSGARTRIICSNQTALVANIGTTSTGAAHTHYVSGSTGDHTHTITVSDFVGNSGDTGSGDVIENRPAYYSMLFIRKCA